MAVEKKLSTLECLIRRVPFPAVLSVHPCSVAG